MPNMPFDTDRNYLVWHRGGAEAPGDRYDSHGPVIDELDRKDAELQSDLDRLAREDWKIISVVVLFVFVPLTLDRAASPAAARVWSAFWLFTAVAAIWRVRASFSRIRQLLVASIEDRRFLCRGLTRDVSGRFKRLRQPRDQQRIGDLILGYKVRLTVLGLIVIFTVLILWDPNLPWTANNVLSILFSGVALLHVPTFVLVRMAMRDVFGLSASLYQAAKSASFEDCRRALREQGASREVNPTARRAAAGAASRLFGVAVLGWQSLVFLGHPPVATIVVAAAAGASLLLNAYYSWTYHRYLALFRDMAHSGRGPTTMPDTIVWRVSGVSRHPRRRRLTLTL